MDSILSVFQDPSVGLTMDPTRLYQAVKKRFPQITKTQVRKWLKEYEITQIQNKTKSDVQFTPIYATPGSWQVDLTFLTDYKRQNNGYYIILCFVEIASRYAVVRALKDKKAKTITDAVFDILQDVPFVGEIQCDPGSEFMSDRFRKLLEQNLISLNMTAPGDKRTMGIVERFNGTLKNMISLYMQSKNTVIWVDKLNDFVENYNSKSKNKYGFHPATMTQEQMKKSYEEEKQNAEDVREHNNELFKVGDLVRIQRKKNIFSKRQPAYNQKIHIIEQVFSSRAKIEGIREPVHLSDLMVVPVNNQPAVEPLEIVAAQQQARLTRRIRRYLD